MPLGDRQYKEFSLAYMQKITDQLTRQNDGRQVPVTLFTKGGGLWLEDLANTGCDALGLDWTVNLSSAKKQVGDKVALQGNMDPAVMLTNPETIKTEAEKILAEYGDGPGHVFNLGHGITPQVPVENVSALVDTVHQASEKYHV